MFNEILTQLRDTYPDTTTISEFPRRKHLFEIIGRIYSFKRATTSVATADDTLSDVSITTVRIHVEDLRLIE